MSATLRSREHQRRHPRSPGGPFQRARSGAPDPRIRVGAPSVSARRRPRASRLAQSPDRSAGLMGSPAAVAGAAPGPAGSTQPPPARIRGPGSHRGRPGRDGRGPQRGAAGRPGRRPGGRADRLGRLVTQRGDRPCRVLGRPGRAGSAPWAGARPGALRGIGRVGRMDGRHDRRGADRRRAQEERTPRARLGAIARRRARPRSGRADRRRPSGEVRAPGGPSRGGRHECLPRRPARGGIGRAAPGEVHGGPRGGCRARRRLAPRWGAGPARPAPARRSLRGRDERRGAPRPRGVRGRERLRGRGRAVAPPAAPVDRELHHRHGPAAGRAGRRAQPARTGLLRIRSTSSTTGA